MNHDDFLPTASLDVLRLRSRLLTCTRRFFDERGYWEVETPLLSHDAAVDSHLEAFETRERPAGPALYLQTSPEFCMKRLLVAGADAIYQLGRVFRRGELGRRHNPEFTMIEWYRAGDDYGRQMQVVEDLVANVFAAANAYGGPSAVPIVPFRRTTYRDAFRRALGVDPFSLTPGECAELATSRLSAVPAGMSESNQDDWLNLLLAEFVEPFLGVDGPEFVYDYPASQAALARVRAGDPPVAERFELYIRGVELCNGYGELTDAQELRRRIAAESARRTAANQSPLPVGNRLVEAMDRGLPECSGVALGFDRLVMLAAGAATIAEVLAFPFDRA